MSRDLAAYVLQASAANPGVPPNRELPEQTIWRIDVPVDGDPVESPLTYGEVPQGAFHKFPESAAPEALVPGQTYYLYVLADVGVPITRCLFDP